MQLDIYIDESCGNCNEARHIAEHVRQQLPQIDVNLIEISGKRPDNVFAVPTYVLDGNTIYLGNPAETEIIERLETGLP